MKKILLSGLLCLACLTLRAQTSPTKPELAAKLDSIFTEDQRYRLSLNEAMAKYGSSSPEMREFALKMKDTDASNTAAVCAILDKYGWLSPAEVGEKGNHALFMVIQHAEQEIQEKYLPMARKAAKKGYVKPSSLALLEDRIAIKQGKKQIYGSQLMPKKDGKFCLSPLKDPDNVDKRRAKVGLPPLAEYLAHFGVKWDVEEYKKELPAIEALQKESLENKKLEKGFLEKRKLEKAKTQKQ